MSKSLKTAIQSVPNWRSMTPADLLAALNAVKHEKNPESDRRWSIAGISRVFGAEVGEAVYQAILAAGLTGNAARFAALGLDATDPQWLAMAAVKVVLMSLLDPKSKTLTLVQNKDYTSTSAIGPVRIKITQASVSKSDTVRLGWTLSSGETGEATGTVVDDAGTLYGEVELTKESHTNLPADNYGKYEFEHINGSGEVSPLLADQRLIILASHPN